MNKHCAVSPCTNEASWIPVWLPRTKVPSAHYEQLYCCKSCCDAFAAAPPAVMEVVVAWVEHNHTEIPQINKEGDIFDHDWHVSWLSPLGGEIDVIFDDRYGLDDRGRPNHKDGYQIWYLEWDRTGGLKNEIELADTFWLWLVPVIIGRTLTEHQDMLNAMDISSDEMEGL